MALAAWSIDDAGPRRLPAGGIDLERNLESWIASDPGLIDAGLFVVQRQLHVDGGYLDLLCVDPQGRATVVEIKRAKLIREVIAQALDYASSIAAMPAEELRECVETYVGDRARDHPGIGALLNEGDDGRRDVQIVVVGVGQEPGLDRMIDYLGSAYDMQIRAVTFDVFEVANGERILIREETEPPSGDNAAPRPSSTIEAVIERAGGRSSPNGARMNQIAQAPLRNGLHVRPWKWSLMLTPPQNKTRYLATIWRWPDKNELALSYSATAFEEFFPVAADEVRGLLGSDEGVHPVLTDLDAKGWTDKLDALGATIGENATRTDET